MDERYKTKLEEFGYDATAPASLGAAADAWKAASDARKGESDSHGEAMRFWIPIAAQLVGMAALVATLGTQQCQHSEAQQQFAATEERSRDSEEDASWRDALAHASKDSGTEPVLGLYAIASFLPSKRYGEQARSIVVTLASHLLEAEVQRDVLEQLKPTHKELVRLSIGMYSAWSDYLSQYAGSYQRYQEQLARYDLAMKSRPAPKNGTPSTSPSPREPTRIQVDTTEAAWKVISDELVATTHDLKFDRGALFNWDFSGQALGNMSMDHGVLATCIVTGSHLRGAKLEDVDWTSTPWWLVADIDKDLFEKLKTNWAFRADQYYSVPNQTQQNYDDNVRRLAH